ncbi:MAG: shikimate kinase, partial [Deltaproteobacteria bacterium]|nr:shikimate kinase [Deltaproteobacteria bacterium]
MPGVGKSTVGVLLAKAMRRAFLDCDLLIQERERQPLQTLLAE